MYAVIRAGGKQYRVAPGDVIEIEKLAQAGGENVQFDDVLAVSGSEGELSKPAKAFVTGQVGVVHLVPQGPVVGHRAEMQPQPDVIRRVVDSEQHVFGPELDVWLLGPDALSPRCQSPR